MEEKGGESRSLVRGRDCKSRTTEPGGSGERMAGPGTLSNPPGHSPVTPAPSRNLGPQINRKLERCHVQVQLLVLLLHSSRHLQEGKEMQ
ncbi:uncharacterized protein [Hemitrygon akajei]|uniref:uncharacterized protein isoform X2 n=1 Tax=Hemitrygon akajei TaxID=2704970 RepID=UPI003BF9DE28